MTIQGVYVGNSQAELYNFENWLGADVDAVHSFVGSSSWADFTGSAKWAANTLWKGIDEKILWSVPLIVNDGQATLATAASGAYNANYLSVAKTLLASRGGDSDPIYIRTGWESNGSWFPWSSLGKEEAFKGAYQQMVTTFRSVSDRFKFEWNVAYDNSSSYDPADAYPGDDYVDIIGMDFYYAQEYLGADPVKAFNWIKNATHGLQWLEDFAAAHGKQTAYSEWGINSDTAGEYIKLVKDWFDTHDVAYQSYWDFTIQKDLVTGLSDMTLPSAGEIFKDMFGDSYYTTGTATKEVTTSPTNYYPGTAGRDDMIGTRGTDVFYGKGGDTMSGGRGDDTYYVTSTADVVVENVAEGNDTVVAGLSSYTLGANLENLVLIGNLQATGTGNELDNRIVGNDAANVLNGRAGNDTLSGGLGNDTFVVAKAEGNDLITDFSHAQGDVIRLDGFAFRDFSAVKSSSAQLGSDVVISLGSGQTLTIQNTQLFALTANDFDLVNIVAPVPSLAVSGTIKAYFTGSSAGGETLTGTTNNDSLNGMGGGDTMKGGLGDDTYVVNHVGDKVVELAQEGVDTVSTWLGSYTLPDNVENLILTGGSWSTGIGNALSNRITGNAAPNTLNGRAGDDILTGGGGADTFVIFHGDGNDVITDFNRTQGDVVRLDNFAFTDFAAVKAATYQLGTDVVIQLAPSQTLTLLNVQASTLMASDFDLVNIARKPVLLDSLPYSGVSKSWVSGTAAGGETLNGTASNDAMNGKGGGDTMRGGLGDDSYIISHASDRIVENTGEGVDTVQTWMSFTLPDNVENLILTGGGWSSGTGNALANRIVGNDAPNIIDGKGGNDVLYGGGGNDTFVIGKGEGTDLILDFQLHSGTANGDTILFKGFGVGAVLVNDGNDFSVRAEDGTVTHVWIANVTQLGAADYAFG
jgi:Ca2+-binding RTX toxin-like protein